MNVAAVAQASAATAGAGQAAAPRAGQQLLTPAEQRQVQKLKSVDRIVRDHEAAHVQAGGDLITSGPNYTYTYGPDGQRYAVGGEVGIDVSATGKPQADIEKGRRVEAAALAPADPSAQDRAVASAARQLAARGQADLVAQRQRERIAKAYGAADGGIGGVVSVSA
jgi:hypothetical protein